jgi:hypothetical protein
MTSLGLNVRAVESCMRNAETKGVVSLLEEDLKWAK